MILLELFAVFFGIGALTFGGGYAMLPLIQEEVLAHGWLTQEQLINFIAVSESTPGPFAINMATYVGTETAGFLGAVCTTLGVVLPSFLIILLVARIYDQFRESRLVKGCMSGLKPAVIGLIGAAILSTGKLVFFPAGFSLTGMLSVSFIGAVVIFIGSFFLSMKKLHPIFVILISAALGIACGYLGKLF